MTCIRCLVWVVSQWGLRMLRLLQESAEKQVILVLINLIEAKIDKEPRTKELWQGLIVHVSENGNEFRCFQLFGDLCRNNHPFIADTASYRLRFLDVLVRANDQDAVRG